MTEKHYAHLTWNYVRDAVRQFAPSFGIKPDDDRKVVTFEAKPALNPLKVTATLPGDARR